MIKIRVQSLPEDIGRTKVSFEKILNIHSISQCYPIKGSQFIRTYFEASVSDNDLTIRTKTVLDMINDLKTKYHDDHKLCFILSELSYEIKKAVSTLEVKS